jgi:hypothetical protein
MTARSGTQRARYFYSGKGLGIGENLCGPRGVKFVKVGPWTAEPLFGAVRRDIGKLQRHPTIR